ncbi:MAG: hypothetical protein IKF83_00965 [Clostridia bacterium]|nr:hypothetical protein [Clostridia bacterium]
MPDEDRGNGTFGYEMDNCNCGCGCGNDNTILWFLIIFLLLFTNFGARG